MSEDEPTNNRQGVTPPSVAAREAECITTANAQGGLRAPGPGSAQMLRNTNRMLRDPLGFLSHLTATYGDVVRCRFIFGDTYILNHPDGIRRVTQDNYRNYTKDVYDYQVFKRFVGETLLTADGETWVRQRRMAQPAFHRRRIQGLGAMITTATNTMLDGWDAGMRQESGAAEERSRDGSLARAIDITEEMSRLTLFIVGKALFGADLTNEASDIARGVYVMSRYATELFYRPFLPVFGPLARKNRDSKAVMAMMDRAVFALIRERRQTLETTPASAADDALSMLLDARDEQGQAMSDQEVRSQMITLLAAGHENLASGLMWTWYLLAHHPEVERRLHAELADVLGGRIPTVEDVAHLPYTRMTLEESLRLYPPAWSFARRVVADDVICGYHIPAGAVVLLSPYTTHRHPAYWERPDEFDPERFSAERSAQRDRFAYFPFSAGPHQCMGAFFAQMEGHLILATAAQRYRLWLKPGQTVEPEALIALRPKEHLHMIAEPRTS